MRSASASASAMSCVQSRMVESCCSRIWRMKSCTSSLLRGSSPVVGSSSSSSTGAVSSARASAIFCCMPARQILHRLAPALGREADHRQDLGDAGARLARPQPVEAGRVAEVLDRRHALEERRLDRDAVDQALHAPRLGEHVDAEHVGAAAVVDQQRREQPHQRRLARAVLAEDGDALAPLHREAEAVQGGDAPPAAAHARAAVAADELLAQVVDLDSRNGGHGGYLIGRGWARAAPRRAGEQDALGLGGGAGAPGVLGATTDRSTAADSVCRCDYRQVDRRY